MPVELACDCGARCEAPEEVRGQQFSCPACGRLIDVPANAAIRLATERFLEQRADLVDCPDCAGSGTCHHCHGKGIVSAWRGWFWTWLMWVFNDAWDSDGRSENALMADEERVKSYDTDSPWNSKRDEVCYRCKRSGRCVRCGGAGQLMT